MAIFLRRTVTEIKTIPLFLFKNEQKCIYMEVTSLVCEEPG
jgi:hypothetical protein